MRGLGLGEDQTPDQRTRRDQLELHDLDVNHSGCDFSVFFDDRRFVLHSELEVEKGYVDLCLLARPESRYREAFDILFEPKFVRRAELGRAGKELRALEEGKLRQLEPVKEAFAEAGKQVRRYREALARKYGADIPRRSYAVVAVGLERLLGEEVPASGRRRHSGGS